MQVEVAPYVVTGQCSGCDRAGVRVASFHGDRHYCADCLHKALRALEKSK
jgi:hypothetical protein